MSALAEAVKCGDAELLPHRQLRVAATGNPGDLCAKGADCSNRRLNSILVKSVATPRARVKYPTVALDRLDALLSFDCGERVDWVSKAEASNHL